MPFTGSAGRSADLQQVARQRRHDFAAAVADQHLILDEETAQTINVPGSLEGEHHTGLKDRVRLC